MIEWYHDDIRACAEDTYSEASLATAISVIIESALTISDKPAALAAHVCLSRTELSYKIQIARHTDTSC